jgi:tripartite-type tricarboxylate transporter receptor subunit TctC
VRSGQLRGLAVTTLKRFPTAPELPTIAEWGPIIKAAGISASN